MHPAALLLAARVVLLTVDAGSDAILDDLQKRHVVAHGFPRIAKSGLVAESMTPQNIASTPISHATIYTGALPSVHGITGVGLLVNGEVQSGFAVPTHVDRLWTIVQSAGKRVVCIVAPGVNVDRADSTCTQTLQFQMPGPVVTHPTNDEAFRDEIFRTVGPSPGQPESSPVTKGQMTDAEYIRRATAFAQWIGEVVKHELQKNDWNLLLVYMPLIDDLEHRYLVTDKRQADDQDPSLRKTYARYIEAGYRTVDDVLQTWIDVDHGRTDFIVTSDHGMIPTHSTVVLSSVIPSEGVRVISSGASAHVYLTDKSKVARIADLIRVFRDPKTRARVFRVLSTAEEIRAAGLDPATSGDLVITARPGWAVTGRTGPGVPSIVPNTLNPDTRARVSRSPEETEFLAGGRLNELSPGVHGHFAGDRRLQAIFMATGPHVPHRRIGTISAIDVAPTVLQILGVPRPEWMTGRDVLAIVP